MAQTLVTLYLNIFDGRVFIHTHQSITLHCCRHWKGSYSQNSENAQQALPMRVKAWLEAVDTGCCHHCLKEATSLGHSSLCESFKDHLSATLCVGRSKSKNGTVDFVYSVEIFRRPLDELIKNLCVFVSLFFSSLDSEQSSCVGHGHQACERCRVRQSAVGGGFALLLGEPCCQCRGRQQGMFFSWFSFCWASHQLCSSYRASPSTTWQHGDLWIMRLEVASVFSSWYAHSIAFHRNLCWGSNELTYARTHTHILTHTCRHTNIHVY